MKITKYILVLLLAFGFGLCQAQTVLAEKEEAKVETRARAVEIAQDAKDVKKDVVASVQQQAQAPKKELTPEEIEHLKIQSKIDQNAIESAQTVRKYLVRFMHWLDKVSPKTAAVMRAEYFGVKGIQYVSAVVVLLLTFVVVKYVLGFVFKRLSALSAKSKDPDTNSFATSFFSQIRKFNGLCAQACKGGHYNFGYAFGAYKLRNECKYAYSLFGYWRYGIGICFARYNSKLFRLGFYYNRPPLYCGRLGKNFFMRRYGRKNRLSLYSH